MLVAKIFCGAGDFVFTGKYCAVGHVVYKVTQRGMSAKGKIRSLSLSTPPNLTRTQPFCERSERNREISRSHSRFAVIIICPHGL
jgi:hypothetical protein